MNRDVGFTKYSLRPDKREDITAVIRAFLETECRDASAVYIFGSFITEDRFEDVDIALLLNEKEPQALQFELLLERRLQEKIGYPVDVRILNGAPLSFCWSVLRSGRLILDRDPNMRADFESNIMKQYSDFSGFMKQYLREVINAPV
jgi:predicted nucleotidyltransferase